MINAVVLKFWAKIWSFKRANFYRDLADALSRKVSLRDFLKREIENAKLLGDNSTAAVMSAVDARFASGDGAKLSELFAGIVPSSDLMLLASVDEAKKDRHIALNKMADAVEFQIRSMKTLGANMVQPIVAIPIVGFLCVLTSEIIASIAKSAPPEIWTGFNGTVRTLAEFIQSWWVFTGVGIIASIVIISIALPRWTGRLRLILDDLPGFGLYRDYNSATVLSAMSMMISSGKTVPQAIEDMSNYATPWLKWHLRRILTSIEDNPNDYVAAFGLGLMSKKIRARMATLLDSAKSFDQALITLGTKEVERLEKSVKTSAVSLNVGITSVLVVVAVTLSMGQMTIASDLSKAADPNKVRKQN